jgi:hypothetical protein
MDAGHSGVGMGATWTSARLASLAIGAAVLLGCSPDQAPSALHGTWYSEDERFDGRTLEIGPEWIRFMQGPRELSAIEVRKVEQEGSGQGPVRFEIEGKDRQGEDTSLSFEISQRPTELLRFDTQTQPWRRTARDNKGKTTVPWGHSKRAADPGGET